MLLEREAELQVLDRRLTETAAGQGGVQALLVTRKTVEATLGNAYGKLGIRSRTQLATALAGEEAAA